MRIGHFVSFGIGGADRAAFNLLNGLSDLGYAPQVFFSDSSFPKRTDDQDEALPMLSIQDLFAEKFEMHRIESISEFQQFDLDILNTHRSGDDEWLLPGLDQIQRKFKIVETNFHGIRNTPADMRIYPSQALVKKMRIGVDRKNLVIFNPILPPISSENLREELSIGPGTVVLGRVGRSDKSIYSPKLLRAFSKLEQSFDVHLIWVGASAKSRADAEKLGVKNVTWVEPIKSPQVVSSYFNTFDIYCHSNKLGETFGNTVAEAMFHGKPVVSLRGKRSYPQAQFELLDDSHQAASTQMEFRKLLAQLISDPMLRESIGQRNARRAQTQFEPQTVAAKYINAYRKVLGW